MMSFVNVYATPSYEKAICRLLSEDARREMEAAIAAAPVAAPIIRGTGGVRKIRWAGSGRGKRGGIRVIYFWLANPDSVFMLGAYAKTKRTDLSAADKKALSRLVATIKQERKVENVAGTN